MLNRTVATSILLAVFVGGTASSQNEKNDTTRPHTAAVYVGQSIEDTKSALEKRGIEHGEGGFAFEKGDPDQSNLFAIVDSKHVSVCIYYSKSKSQVTGLDLVFSPGRRFGKLYESWVSAKKLVLHEDGCYAVLFNPPATHEKPQPVKSKKAESQLPRSSN